MELIYKTQETIMADILVMDWMEEFESLTESEIHTYSSEQENNHEVMIALYDVLTEPYRYKGEHLVDGICRQLFDFYRSGEEQLRKFALQYIPTLVFLHLSDKSYTSVQTLLVSLYNLEVIDSKAQPRTLSFRVPSIAQSSIYHDSNNLEPAFIAENSLRRWEECNSKLVSWGPLPQVECLNAQNRQRVVTALVFLFNQQLSNIIQQGIEYTCKGIIKLLTQGFHHNNSFIHSSSTRSSLNNTTSCSSENSFNQNLLIRIQVSSPLMLELLNIVYYAAEKGINGSMQALNEIIQRATYETYCDVLLASNAVKNLLQHSSTVSITPRPSQSHTITKSMITNASFRTKKLPDDIPIQDEQTDLPLDSITEEQTDEAERKKSSSGGGGGGGGSGGGGVGALKHLPKLPGLGKKHKIKSNPQQDVVEFSNASGDEKIDQSSPDINHTVHVSAV